MREIWNVQSNPAPPIPASRSIGATQQGRYSILSVLRIENDEVLVPRGLMQTPRTSGKQLRVVVTPLLWQHNHVQARHNQVGAEEEQNTIEVLEPS